jgi:hypothetical protein
MTDVDVEGARGMREAIIEALNALAAEADVQRDYLRNEKVPVDELHNQLLDVAPGWLMYLHRYDLSSALAEQRLDAVINQLAWMFRQGSSLWQEESLELGPWTVVRELAQRAADAFRAAGPSPTSENYGFPIYN